MSEFVDNEVSNTGEDGPWGKDFQKDVPPFTPDQQNNTEHAREELDKMPLDTNEQQVEYLDAYLEAGYGDDSREEGEGLNKVELGRGILADLNGELKNPENIGRTVYDLIRERQREVEQSQTDFEVTGEEGAWTQEDQLRSQTLFEQRELLISMAGALKEAPALRGERDSVLNQENFRESYCLKKRDIKKSRLENALARYKEELKEVDGNEKLTDYARESKKAEIGNEIDDTLYRIDCAERESDMLREAIIRKKEGQGTRDVLKEDIAKTEKTIDYYKGLLDSAKTESAKVGFRRTYKEAREKLKRLEAVVLDLDEAKEKGIRLG